MSKFDFLKPRIAEWDAWLAEIDIPPSGIVIPNDDVECAHFRFTWGVILFDQTNGPDPENIALKTVCKFLEILAHGYKTFIRKKPWADIETNFETEEVLSKAGVRFYIYPEEGEWFY